MSPPQSSALALNLVTTRSSWTLAQAIEACARHGIRGIAPWRDQVHAMGLKNASASIRSHGLAVTGLCSGGRFPARTAGLRKAAVQDNLRAIDEAAELSAGCLIMVVGGLPPESTDVAGARAQVMEGIAEVLPHARGAGVRLALEPLHPMQLNIACVNTLEQALDLCDLLDPDGSGALGVAVDVYHVWWDPKLEQQILRAGPRRLHAFHLSDWLVPTRDLFDDRGMMGDGIIDVRGIRRFMEAAGYAGMHEVELFSTTWARHDPDELMKIIKRRHQTFC